VVVAAEVVWVPVSERVVDPVVVLAVGQALVLGLVPGLGRAPVSAQVPGRAWRSRQIVTG